MAGVLEVSPTTNFTATGVENGTFTDQTKYYLISNTGDASLDYTITNTNSWLTVSDESGTLIADQTKEVLVSVNIDASTLDAGTYTDTITFTNTTTGVGNTTRSVTLTVTIEPYAIKFLPQTLQENDFMQWLCDIIDYTIITLKQTDDPFLSIPQEFVDLIGTYTDEEAVIAYYNTIVKPSIGTKWLMSLLVTLYDTPYTVQEWFEYDGEHFHFRLANTATTEDFSKETRDKLVAIINFSKNERSILDGFIITLSEFSDSISSVTDLSLGGNVLTYALYNGVYYYDGSIYYAPLTTTPFS